jgi:hypothetical protein
MNDARQMARALAYDLARETYKLDRAAPDGSTRDMTDERREPAA